MTVRLSLTVAALMAVVSAVFFMFASTISHGDERLSITTPLNDGAVEPIISVEGTVSLGEGEVLVILAKNDRYGWWHQGQTDASGNFNFHPVYIGDPKDPSGTTFTIGAFIVSREQAAKMREYKEYYGSVPDPVKKLTVKRK